MAISLLCSRHPLITRGLGSTNGIITSVLLFTLIKFVVAAVTTAVVVVVVDVVVVFGGIVDVVVGTVVELVEVIIYGITSEYCLADPKLFTICLAAFLDSKIYNK